MISSVSNILRKFKGVWNLQINIIQHHTTSLHETSLATHHCEKHHTTSLTMRQTTQSHCEQHHTNSLWEKPCNITVKNTTTTTLKVLISCEEFKGNVKLLIFWHWESEGLENIGELILAWMLLRA